MKETIFSEKLFGDKITILVYDTYTEKVKETLKQAYIEALRLGLCLF